MQTKHQKRLKALQMCKEVLADLEYHAEHRCFLTDDEGEVTTEVNIKLRETYINHIVKKKAEIEHLEKLTNTWV